jgi:uncharacterized lipoprotein YmbA
MNALPSNGLLTARLGRRPRRPRRPVVRLAWFASAALLLASCTLPLPQAQPDATKYYLLSAARGAPATGGAAGGEIGRVIGLRDVEVPAYLRPKSFVLRSAPNEIRYLDFTCWGEPLEQGLARVLAEDLRSYPGISRVALAPFRPAEQRNFDVVVRLEACEGTAAGEVLFSAEWRIVAPDSGATVAAGTYTAPERRWKSRDYGSLAAKLSEAVSGLGRAIDAALPPGPRG